MRAGSTRRGGVARKARNCWRVAEPLEGRTLFSIMINGTAGNDTITLSWHSSGTGGTVFIDANVNGTPVSLPASFTDVLQVDTGTGQDTVNVLSTVLPTTINGHGSATADHTLNVGSPTATPASYGLIHAENPSGYWNVNIDDSHNPANATASLFTQLSGITILGEVSGLATPPVEYVHGDVDNLVVKTGTGSDTVNVRSTTIRGNTLVQGNAQITVNVGDHGSIGGITSPLRIEDPPAYARVTLDDSANTAPQTFTLDTVSRTGESGPFLRVQRPSTAEILCKWNDLASPFILNAGSGGNTFTVAGLFPSPGDVHTVDLNTGTGTDTTYVWGTQSGTTLNIHGQDGADTVKIGYGGNAQGIGGTVTVDNSGYYTSLFVDDSNDASPRTVTLDTTTVGIDTDWQKIAGITPGTIEYQGHGISAPTLLGGSGGNTFNVLHTASYLPSTPEPALVLGTGDGNDTVNVSSIAGQLVVNGEGGNDTLALNVAAGAMNSPLIYDGGMGNDVLMLAGAGPADPFTISAFAITHGSVNLTYVNLEAFQLGPGAFTDSADLSGVSVTTTGPGSTLAFNVSQHLRSLHVGDGTTVQVAASAAPAGKTIFCSDLAIVGSGKLDLTNDVLQLNYALPDPIASIRAALASGYNGGAWTGAGIVSTASDGTHGLALADSADGVVPSLPADTILVRFTRYGDVNLDGTVNFADLLALAQHYGRTSANWDQGDLTYDGSVGFSDLLKLAQNYGATAAAAPVLAIAGSDPAMQRRRSRAFST